MRHCAEGSKRSLTIAGHRTSLSLEPEFWEAVRKAAALRGVTPAALVSEIDQTRGSRNLSSAVRVWILEDRAIARAVNRAVREMIDGGARRLGQDDGPTGSASSAAAGRRRWPLGLAGASFPALGEPREPPPDAQFAQALAGFGLVDLGIGAAFGLDLAAQPVGGGDLHLGMDLQFTPAQQHFVALGIIGLEAGFVLETLLLLVRGKADLLLLQALQLVDALLHDGDAQRGRELGIVFRARQHAGGPA